MPKRYFMSNRQDKYFSHALEIAAFSPSRADAYGPGSIHNHFRLPLSWVSSGERRAGRIGFQRPDSLQMVIFVGVLAGV